MGRFRTIVAVCGAVVFAGCAQYSEEKIFKEDPSFVGGEEQITSVVLRTGETVTFDENGGHFVTTYVVTGVSMAGDTIRLPSTKVSETRAVILPFLDPGQAENQRFAEALLVSGHLVRFDKYGGKVAKGFLTGNVREKGRSEYPIAGVRGLRVTAPPLSPDPIASPIREIITFPDNRLIMFDSSGGRLEDARSVISGFAGPGKLVSVPFDSVLYGRVRRYDAGKTFLASLGGVALVAGAAAAIIAATKQCCPFVYSYDGTGYVFDAEPLGGATTAGLARTDYSRLEYLQAVDGQYRLLLRNEVEETQYIDRAQLMYVDHDPSVNPVSFGGGQIMFVREATPPLEALDEQGTDLLPFLRARDNVAWETHMPSLTWEHPDSTRQIITLRFLKPRGAMRATLVVHGGTTLWGSNVIRLLYELRGDRVDQWYGEADRRGPALYQVLTWLDREELYALKVSLLRRGTWQTRGTIVGGGPLVHESQLVPLSVSSADGDTLVLRLRPPVGFWSFDQIAVTFDDGVPVPLTPVRSLTAIDHHGRDVAGLLSAEDHAFLEMPARGDQTVMTFDAPPVLPGKTRSLFLASSGFYRLHLRKDTPEDSGTLARLVGTPGEVVRYSTAMYARWQRTFGAAIPAVTH